MHDVWVAKPKRAPMVGAPGMIANHSIPAWSRFVRALKHPGSILAPPFDDNHMLPLGSGIAEGTSVLTIANNTTHYPVLLIRTAASALYSTSPATQLGIFNSLGLLAAGTVTGPDIGGTGTVTWASMYGDTAPSSRVIPWATTLEVIVNAPPSVIQGSIWVGNMPMQQIIGRGPEDLIRNATYSYAADHLPFVMKNTITELGTFHSEPVTKSAETDAKKFDPVERITYMVLSPSLVGSITGSIPSSYQITVTGKTNYAWVPVYQPIVSKTVEAEILVDSECKISPKAKAELADTIQSEATSAVPDGAQAHSFNTDSFRTPPETHGMGPKERKMLRLGDAGPAGQGSAEDNDLRRRLLENRKNVNPEEGGWRYGPIIGPTYPGQHIQVKYHSHPHFLPPPEDRHYHDPIKELPAYDGYVADCEYLSRILQARWKSLREDSDAASSYLMLRDAIRKASEALSELHERNKSEREQYTEVEYVETDEDVYVCRYTLEGKPYRLNALPVMNRELDRSSFRDSSVQSKKK